MIFNITLPGSTSFITILLPKGNNLQLSTSQILYKQRGTNMDGNYLAAKKKYTLVRVLNIRDIRNFGLNHLYFSVMRTLIKLDLKVTDNYGFITGELEIFCHNMKRHHNI